MDTQTISIRELQSELIGQSDPIRAIVEEIECASRSDANVMVTGESGVGKKVVARLIHAHSHRRASSLVTIDCACVPGAHLESAMFGNSGSVGSDKMGCLEQADGSTLFIDEIGDMTPRVQALLLRFLEDGQIHDTSGGRSVVDVRIIAATSRNLLTQIAEEAFLEDLYYRLNMFHLPIPPLRERRHDIPALFSSFVRSYCRQHRVPEPVLAEEALAPLISYDWPGNVRELKHVVGRILRHSRGTITRADLPKEMLSSM